MPYTDYVALAVNVMMEFGWAHAQTSLEAAMHKRLGFVPTFWLPLDAPSDLEALQRALMISGLYGEVQSKDPGYAHMDPRVGCMLRYVPV